MTTNAHETRYHLTPTDTSIASSASDSEPESISVEESCERPYSSDADTGYRNASRIDPFYNNDRQAAITVSLRSIVTPAANVAVREPCSPLRVERSSPSIADSSDSELVRRNDSQDERPDASSHLQLINQETDLNTPADPSLSTEDEFLPGKDCPTRRDFLSSRFTWLSGTIIVICSVSTALSAVFVMLASKGQRYGSYIGSNPEATISISTAILWTSVVAKTIEISFVTGFVAFLGQVLSRRAFVDANGPGVTLSELTMWRWIVQPGTLVVQPEIARYAGLSTLGILTLVSTVLSTLYVTAATALVQPISKQSDWGAKTMVGSVQSDYANVINIANLCQTLPLLDKDHGANTCMEIDDVGKSSYNLAQFLAKWVDIANGATKDDTSINQENRLAWIGLPYVNTTIVPQWVDTIDTAEVSSRHQRVINNVSLALPHIGVSNAVRDQRNSMPQSESSESIEAYSLWASVLSPVMKVLCVHMNRTELAPIIYEAWPDTEEVNVINWNASPGPSDQATTTNKTIVDEIFGWTKEDADMIDYPPVFAKYPLPFNTILNHTSRTWRRSAIYLLGQGGSLNSSENSSNSSGVYSLCKLEVDISPNCSTRHSVAVSGNKVEALCEEQADDMAYFKTRPNAKGIRGLPGWRDVGANWAMSLSLDRGIADGNSSQSRALMSLQLQPEDADPTSLKVKLNYLRPSLAETLAIAASDTLLSSLQGAPFVEFWNYTHSTLDAPQTQWFTAKIKSREYASGGVDNASKGWLVVLISTFLLNVVVLVYFIVQPGLVTDFSQPPQLFALAVNSPPTRAFAGSCGGGPEGKEYRIGWLIGYERGHLYIEPGSGRESTFVTDKPDSDSVPAHQPTHRDAQTGSSLFSTVSAALGRMKPKSKSRTSRRTGTSGAEPARSSSTSESVPSLQSQYELGDIETRAQQQYIRLPKSRSFL